MNFFYNLGTWCNVQEPKLKVVNFANNLDSDEAGHIYI